MRWRYGETNPVVGQVPEDVSVEIGDLVYYDSDSVKPASLYTVQSSKSLSQSGFAAKFLGVAMQRSPAGEISSIRIATSGVFEYDATQNTFILGAYVGIEERPSRAGIETQKVSTSTAEGAVGRVVRREPVATNVVYIKIQSRIIG